MKKHSTFALVVLLALTFTAAAVAQPRTIAKANIPFTFFVHERSFAPGEYKVRQLGSSVLRIENAVSGNGITEVVSIAIAGEGSGKLVFHRYGDHYFLAAIVAPAGSYGVELPKSAAEREAHAAQRNPARVMVAMK